LKEKHKDEKCDKCSELMDVKTGRYGPFLGCSNYPTCKNIVSIVVSSGVKCIKCGKGQLIERRTRKGGRVFWGCDKYPKCKHATWNKPLEVSKDGKKMLLEGKDGESFYVDAEGNKV